MPQRGVGCGLLAMMFHLEHVAALTVDGHPECGASSSVDDGKSDVGAFIAIGLREDDYVGVCGVSHRRCVCVTGAGDVVFC